MNIDGGSFVVGTTPEFRVGGWDSLTGTGTVRITAGSLVVSNLFRLHRGSVTLSGGLISVNGSNNWNGVYTSGNSYLNFVSPSKGALFVDNIAVGQAVSNLLMTGKVRLDGAINPSGFYVTAQGAGARISAVPAPTVVVVK